MGLRGLGARSQKEAKAEALRRNRKLPWEAEGLSRVDRVIKFVQWLPITKGIRAGKRFRLLPGQRQFIEDVYGREDRAGRRVASLAIKSEPKGNGKTGLAAPLALCHLLGPESEPRGEVYSAALDRFQAGIVYAEMEAIVRAVPEFESRCNPTRFHKKIEVLEGAGKGSMYEALSADARRAHGLAPSLWIYDELAQARDRRLLDNLLEGMGKRDESLGMVISTQAPDDDHPLSQLIDDGLECSDGSIVVHLTAAPMDSDPFDPAVIKAANPAWGKFLQPKDLIASAERARRMPVFEPAFRNLRLNQRVAMDDSAHLVTRSVWEAAMSPIDLSELQGRECYGGLDLSGKMDLTALVLAFPDHEGGFDLVPYFWTPAGQLEARRPRERELFDAWIRAGLITKTPGQVIRFGYVAEQLGELAREFDIRSIGYDRWRIDDFKVDMADAGVELHLEPYGQGFRDMAPAIEYFAELCLSGQLRHGGHQVLTNCVANAITISDPAGNMKIDKSKALKNQTVRIDGAVAAIMALGTFKKAAEHDADTGPSVYENPNVFM